MDTQFEPYFELRNTLDEQILKFEKMHAGELKCRKGCDSCCESLTVFPIEFFSIQSKINTQQLPPKKWKHKFGKSCRFLVAGECQIYEHRPIICRTQGLPLLYESHTGTTHELSVCRLNFIGTPVNKFSMSNALFMPPYNSKLFLANKHFVDHNPNLKFGVTRRISLNTL